MLASSAFRQALREAAPTLSKRFFSCQARNPRASPATAFSSCKRSFTRDFQNARRGWQHYRGFASTSRRNVATSLSINASKSALARSGFFPETTDKKVAYWLLASAASVFGIVVFGGLTRLTESGLSITEWRPVTGSLPPMSQADWDSEFDKYRASPEFQVLNSRMTLEEFKSIYWMEWIHRVWGRVVGMTFVLPAVYFISKRQVSKPMTGRIAGIAALIGFQGFLGWWMVKSGLKDDFLDPNRKPGRDVPRVSQYRLAAHLGTAFVAYLSMLWCGLDILRTHRLLNVLPAKEAASTIERALKFAPQLRSFKIATAALLGLTYTTAMSGALVAGLDAGLIYNEFPYMGVGLTPPRSELFDSFYSRDPTGENRDWWWRNFLENPSLVQLDHRILATTTFTSIMALFAWGRFGAPAKLLPRPAAKALHGVFGFAWLQVILGISTLIYMVPVPLASAHQAGALALLSYVTVLGSRVWMPQQAAALLQRRIAQYGTSTTQSTQQLMQKTAGAASISASESAPTHILRETLPTGQRFTGASTPALQASLGAAAFGLSALVAVSSAEETKKQKKKQKQQPDRSSLHQNQLRYLQWQTKR